MVFAIALVVAGHGWAEAGPAWESEAEFAAASPVAGSWHGFDTDLDGNTLIVGAPRTQVGGSWNVGAAHVYVRDALTGLWSHQAALSPDASSGFIQFGWAVAVDGDRAAGGARAQRVDGVSTAGVVSAWPFGPPDHAPAG